MTTAASVRFAVRRALAALPGGSRLSAAPPWVWIVVVVTVLGTGFTVWAAVDVAQHPFYRPGWFAGGVVATFAISFLYVTVVQRGEVLEAIDLSEAPVVSLSLILPPAEAVLAIALGSVLSQLRPRRSLAKKAFNVGIRCVGAGALEATASVVGRLGTPQAGWPAAAVIPGAVVYTLIGAVAVAAVVASVEGGSIPAIVTRAWRPRLVAWGGAVVIGCSAATTAVHHPFALVGVSSALALVAYATKALQTEQQERRRLECLVEASSVVLDAPDEAAQDAAVLDAARQLMLWRDVSLLEAPPDDPDVPAVEWRAGGRARWLVARNRPGADSWSPHDSRVLGALGAAAGRAYERAQMQQELVRRASVDPLTGLANRREFDARLDEALASGQRLALLVVDLDGFKPVNDGFGHQAGDELLRVVGTRLTESVRDTDVVARTGGDEFALLLRGAGRGVADAVGAQIRAKLGETVDLGRWSVTVSASVGVAVSSADGTSRSELMRRADQRMYAEKRSRGASRFLAVTTTADADALVPPA